MNQRLPMMTLQLEACQSRVEELQTLLSSTTSRLQQSELQVEMLAAERDAVARNLVTAEAELVDVGEYSTKMFRQVRTQVCNPVWTDIQCSSCICVCKQLIPHGDNMLGLRHLLTMFAACHVHCVVTGCTCRSVSSATCWTRTAQS